MNKWKYIETDGYPEKPGHYEVAIEQKFTFTCADDPKENERIYGPFIGICAFNGERFVTGDGSLNMEDEMMMCDADHIYAWADVLLPAPKQIYPSKTVKIDPAEYHLTKDQLMGFLEYYKRSFERGTE